MKFLLLCCTDEGTWAALPERERERIMGEYGAWAEALAKEGRHLASAKLEPVAAASTVRMRAGERSVTDGPFAETKEQIGGYHLIECGDREEAIAIAARIPTLPVGGTVEVRRVDEAYGA